MLSFFLDSYNVERFGGKGERRDFPTTCKGTNNDTMYLSVTINALTLRGLSLFFKMLPISNTGVSAAYIMHRVGVKCHIYVTSVL